LTIQYKETPGKVLMPDANRMFEERLSVKKSLLQTLVDMLGSEAAEKLIAEFGGARIWVPVQSTATSKLSKVLGSDAASALCARFGGDYLQVPNARTPGNVHRRIAELHRQGCKINDIALAVGRSRRTVFRLLRRKITDLRKISCQLKIDPRGL
jgi:Helix-turn-helix domain